MPPQEPPPSPQSPTDSVLTPPQWTALLALADTFIPSLPPSSLSSTVPTPIHPPTFPSTFPPSARNPPEELVAAYLAETPSGIAGFRAGIEATLRAYVHAEGREGIRGVLEMLSTPAGTATLTGLPPSAPFHALPPPTREAILRAWLAPPTPEPLQAFARAVGLLVRKIWCLATPTLGDLLGFPEKPVLPAVEEGYKFEFLDLAGDVNEGPAELETDVVIVGSGCGGGVVAARLAAAGRRVLVLEKGAHHPTSAFPMSAADAGVHLYENGGAVVSEDSRIPVLAGATWGGGGTVNWAAALRLPAHTRAEWDAATGLPGRFTDGRFEDAVERVCKRMGVGRVREHNFANKKVLEAAGRLGWGVQEVEQNAGGKEHACGHCTFGCGRGVKQGPAVSWLPDAAREGARFVKGVRVERVLFDEGGKRAVGVEGVWTSGEGVERRVVVRARVVVVSAGTLNSPLLLARSGVRNEQLGRNLHIHPSSFVAGVYAEDVRPWEGAILTTVMTGVEDLDGAGYGSKVECTSMLPGQLAPLFPWACGAQYKLAVARFRHMAGFVVLTRDRDGGRVFADPGDGRVRIDYVESDHDLGHLTEGLVAAAKMAYVTGAREVHLMHPGIAPFVAAEEEGSGAERRVDDPAFAAWLAGVRAESERSPQLHSRASAHQMGTCRMSADPAGGIVDGEGRVHGCEGLYVADASVFPTASGVNPMVTNMAIADLVAGGIVERWRE